MFSFFKAHGYTLLVTALVLTLGAASRQVRIARTTPRAASPVSAAAVLPTALPAVSPEPTVAPSHTWLRPVSGGLITAYSASPQWNADMDCWQVHTGVDIAAVPGETVQAAAEGTVYSITNDPLLGLTVTLTHRDGYATRYASLRQAHCSVGDRLNAGKSLGTAGNSADSEALMGCHVHFELLHNDLPLKPFFE